MSLSHLFPFLYLCLYHSISLLTLTISVSNFTNYLPFILSWKILCDAGIVTKAPETKGHVTSLYKCLDLTNAIVIKNATGIRWQENIHTLTFLHIHTHTQTPTYHSKTVYWLLTGAQQNNISMIPRLIYLRYNRVTYRSTVSSRQTSEINNTEISGFTEMAPNLRM